MGSTQKSEPKSCITDLFLKRTFCCSYRFFMTSSTRDDKIFGFHVENDLYADRIRTVMVFFWRDTSATKIIAVK